jgi:hypothetical protein
MATRAITPGQALTDRGATAWVDDAFAKVKVPAGLI